MSRNRHRKPSHVHHRHEERVTRPSEVINPIPEANDPDYLNELLNAGEGAEQKQRNNLREEGMTAYLTSDSLDDKIKEVITFYGIMLSRQTAIQIAARMKSVRMMKHAVTEQFHYLGIDPSSFEQGIKFFEEELPKEELWTPDMYADAHSDDSYFNPSREI